MSALVLRADARALPLPARSVDAVVCDPPYEISFMARSWDAAGVAFDPRTWAEALRVLKPGGHLLAFGGTRTWHRLVCAVEDAGFEIRDSVMWLYGSGFPKSLDVAKAIDVGYIGDGDRRLTAPATDDARRWQGWGTALKPGYEPIVVARKPLAGTVASNVLGYGTGALNIDGCRIASSEPIASHHMTNGTKVAMGEGWHDAYASGDAGKLTQTVGRWPTNVVLSHPPLLDEHGQVIGDGCEDGCVPGCLVADLDRQSGTTVSAGGSGAHSGRLGYGSGVNGTNVGQNAGGLGDSGGASRFFPTFRYQAKADDWERPRVNGVAHPTVKPLDLIRWLVRLVTPPAGLVLDQYAGSGTTVEAALMEGFPVIGIENWEPYLPLIAFRVDRARRRSQPGIARLGRPKPATESEGQGDLLAALFVEGES
jgi:site-specific DNA-methyltransferase (adenine-specific)